MRLAPAAAALGVLLAATTAQATVFRCTEADGGITYQDRACRDGATNGATDIPTQFPPPNEAERARLLEREALLEQRLEQRRERESREARLRSVAAPAPAAPDAYVEGYPLYFPLVLRRPLLRPHAPHRRAHASGGLNAARP